jgi:phage terminase small subunit
MSLTPKQFKFVQEYLIDMNATQAAIRAGYSKKTAHSSGPRLLENVGIKEEIEKAQLRMEMKTDITKQKILEKLWGIVVRNEEDMEMYAMKAIEIINKMQGYNEPDKQEVEHKGLTGFNINIKKSDD